MAGFPFEPEGMTHSRNSQSAEKLNFEVWSVDRELILDSSLHGTETSGKHDFDVRDTVVWEL